MQIRTDAGNFDRDRIKIIDRIKDGHVIVELENPRETLNLWGLSAQQAWAQVTEQQEGTICDLSAAYKWWRQNWRQGK